MPARLSPPDRTITFPEIDQPGDADQVSPLIRLKADIARARIACALVQFVTARTGSLMGATRGSPEQALARQLAMYLTHVGFGMSLQRTAQAFARDRSTIAHACHKIEDIRDEPGMDELLEQLEQALACLPQPDAALLCEAGESLARAA